LLVFPGLLFKGRFCPGLVVRQVRGQASGLDPYHDNSAPITPGCSFPSDIGCRAVWSRDWLVPDRTGIAGSGIRDASPSGVEPAFRL